MKKHKWWLLCSNRRYELLLSNILQKKKDRQQRCLSPTCKFLMRTMTPVSSLMTRRWYAVSLTPVWRPVRGPFQATRPGDLGCSSLPIQARKAGATLFPQCCLTIMIASCIVLPPTAEGARTNQVQRKRLQSTTIGPKNTTQNNQAQKTIHL